MKPVTKTPSSIIMQSPQLPAGYFFKDGIRRIDYVMVIDEENLEKLNIFQKGLKDLGLQFEVNKGISVDQIFLLVHLPAAALKHLSKLYDVGNEEKKVNLKLDYNIHLGLFQTPISKIKDKEKGEYTSAERIIIVNKTLENTKYGEEPSEIGITKLIRLGIVSTAYPLHDGPVTLEDLTLSDNDRQLLFHYWANHKVWYKEMPLDMINKYFGSEIAFYFAWLQFFNIMLFPVAATGLVVIIVNIILANTSVIQQVKEVCEDDHKFICPRCQTQRTCSYSALSDSCNIAKWSYVIDNYMTVIFAICMSFWATFFLNLWRRRASRLKLRWDLTFEEAETESRLEYLDRVKRRKFSLITGNLEPYEPRHIKVARITLTIFICFLMILMVVLAVFGVIIVKMRTKEAMLKKKTLKRNAKFLSLVFGSIIQVTFIKLFGKIYGKLSIWLTNYENPRTQNEFDKSVLYKRFLLSFVNNYTGLFYIAFFKGRFYHGPDQYKIFPVLERDTCQPLTCVADLFTALFFVMVFKRLTGNLVTLFYPHIKKSIKKLMRMRHSAVIEPTLPNYEEEYNLLPTNRYLLTTEFCEMIIEYGFVTFFVATFPVAPLISFLNNLLELRLDAFKMVTRYRRPNPRRVTGIGAWDGVLLGITYMSTATNAFVIAFTSDFVPREVYAAKYKSSLEGFINSTLSEFATKDYDLYQKNKLNLDTCYYRAMRYPPGGPEEYELTTDYWVDFTWRLISVFVFEHIIFFANAILAYAIPDIPQSVKDQLNIDRQLAKEAKLKLLNEDMVRKSKQGEKSGTPLRKRKKDDYVQIGPVRGFDKKKAP